LRPDFKMYENFCAHLAAIVIVVDYEIFNIFLFGKRKDTTAVTFFNTPAHY
jgi:hypothetical protein